MPEVEINGITVIFPFKPYKEQMDYMTKVIQCLQNGKHGVLESPTGTGKTLSLLCASLSWLQTRKAQLQAQAAMAAGPPSDTGGKFLENLSHDLQNAAGTLGPLQNRTFGMSMPKIIYASRTHSQLSQAMQELKRTAYKHVKVAVIGSRDQLCIHPEVSKEENSSGKIHNCQARVRAKKCIFHINVEKNKDDPVFKNEICDIEDLVKNGQKLKCCPYYLAKDLKETADITFMPYNYLLDPKTRKLQGIDLQNHILLIDEAHNVEKTCEEAASLEISSTDIALCIDEVTKAMKDIADQLSEDIGMLLEGPGNNLQKDFTPDDLCILKDLLLAFEKAVDGIPLEMGKSGETKAGSYIFEILAEAGLTHGKEHAVIDKLDKIILYLSTVNNSPFVRGGNALHKFSTFLKTVFSSTGSNPSEHKKRVEQAYKVYIEPEKVKSEGKTTNWDPKKPERKSRAKSINYWCFSPAFGMRQLLDQGVHSIILTSGTLSPLGPFIEELGIPVDYQLSNPHIVSQKQIWAGIVKQGPDDFQLNSSHETRNDSRYIHSLGRTVLSFAKIVPDGLLVFFPSYPMMEKCRGEWQKEGLWSLMTAVKPIFVEPQGKTHFNAVMEEFYKKVRDPEHRGAIFLAVCRGKVSEGLDFADANGRAVLITGLPFTPVNDPKIKLKRQYLEELRATKRAGLSGIDWYVLSALRAVNQAVGRIIRHKDDYGAIIFCDLRFHRSDLMQKLSTWLRPSIKVYDKFGPVVRNLTSFFKQATSTLPQPTATRSVESSAPDGGSSFENITRIRETPTTFSQMSTTVAYNFDEDFEALHVYEKKPEGETSTLKTSADSSKPSSINFGTLKAVGGWSISELVRPPVSDEPAAKKRKFNIQPKEIMYDPMPSTSGVSHNVQDSANGQNKKTPDKKKESGKLYLNEVKKSLTQANYKIFATMISTYTSTGDFDELMKTLDRLFPTGSGLEHLLKGFRTYLKKHHLAQFDARIK